MSDVLPDCMMPDGAEPCAGYRTLAAENAELKQRVAELEVAMQKGAVSIPKRPHAPAEDWCLILAEAYISHEHAVAKAAIATLQSIASNSCCERCIEAAIWAKATMLEIKNSGWRAGDE